MAAPVGAKLTGYRLLTTDGRVLTFSKSSTLGSPRDKGLASGTAIAGVAGRNSYLTTDPAGHVVGFGGPAGGNTSDRIQAADVAATPSGQGYWVLTSTGGVYAFGTAKHHGSLSRSGVTAGGLKLRSTPSGSGYWILARDGRIHPFGDAKKLNFPGSGAVDFWPTPSGAGYWVLLADGRVAPSATPATSAMSPASRCAGRSRRWRSSACRAAGLRDRRRRTAASTTSAAHRSSAAWPAADARSSAWPWPSADAGG